MNLRSIRTKRLSVCAMALLTGCSVLTVDVDVYKGPLANHNDIQTQQTVYLAVAAKPMLAKLRYLLEYRALADRYRTNPEFESFMRDRLEYVEPGLPASDGVEALNDDKGHYRFRSPEAAYVNEIFKLYADEAERTYINSKLYPAKATTTAPTASTEADLNSLLRSFNDSLKDRDKESTSGERTALGIESLLAIYEQYGRALDAARSGDLENFEARRKLADAEAAHKRIQDELFSRLVYFSQQLLFVANNDVLIKQLDMQPWIGEQFWEAMTPVVGGRPRNLSYTRVLQTVGNSILVQVDELRQFASHGTRMNVLHSVEVQAKSSLQVSRAQEVIEQVTSTLDGRALASGQGLSAVDASALAQTYDTEKRNLQTLAGEKTDAEKAAADAQIALVAPRISKKRVEGFFNLNNVMWSPHREKHVGSKVVNANDYYTDVIDTLKWFIGNTDTPQTFEDEAQDIKNVLSDPDLKAAFFLKSDSSRDVLFGQLKNEATSRLDQILKLEELEKLASGSSETAKVKQADFLKADQALRRRLEQVQAVQARSMWQSVVDDWKKEQDSNPGASTLNVVDQIRVARTKVFARRALADGKSDIEANLISDAIDDVAQAAGVFQPVGDRSPVDVLDQIIATFRQQLIETIAREGKASPKVERLEAAIAEASRQREIFTYIRPASAYLRTSNTATSLQRDARLYWNNTLLDQSLRSIPFLGSLTANPPSKDVRTVLELDKQFWHNINTVRVSGGGRTNYVIAKDDVGNWYVKNYSADPEPVIKGAMGLVQFAAAGQNVSSAATGVLSKAVSQDAAAKIATGKAQGKEVDKLIERVASARKAEGSSSTTQPSTVTAEEKTLLAQQVASLSAAYVNESRTNTNELIKSGSELDVNISAAWEKIPDWSKLSEARKAALTKARNDAIANFKLPEALKDEPAVDPLATVDPLSSFIPAIRSVSGYERSVAKNLAALPAGTTDAEKLDADLTNVAAGILKAMAGKVRSDAFEKQTRSLNRFADGVSLLDQSASGKLTPATTDGKPK